MSEQIQESVSELDGWKQAVEDTSQHPELHAIAKDHFERVKASLEISPEHHQAHVDIARHAVPEIDSLPPAEQDLIGEIIEIGEEALSDSIQTPLEAKKTHETNGHLPTAEELSDILSAELSLAVPSRVRLMEPGEKPNVRVLNFDDAEIDVKSPDLLPKLQSEYIEQNVDQLINKAWWVKLDKLLSHGGEPQPINILAKHVLEAKARNSRVDQHYEIFEVGDEPLTDEERQAAVDTMKLIDQLSGGLLSAEEARRPVVLGTGLQYKDADTHGFNSNELTYVDVSDLRAFATKYDTSIVDGIRGVIIHEILGHQLERTVEGDVGKLFRKHFDYSEERKEGNVFNIHESITPKDTTIVESSPVREYGHKNSAEDLATSITTSVAAAMEWGEDQDPEHRPSNRVDSYRRDIELALMQAAAEKAKSNEGTPGFVGSEIEYTQDGTGNLEVAPVRQYELQTTRGEDARQEEIAKLTAKIKQDSELIVRVDAPVY